jgi:hypothetical protein
VEIEGKSDTGNKGSTDWTHFEITQTKPEQYNGEARNWSITTKTAVLGAAHFLRKLLM